MNTFWQDLKAALRRLFHGGKAGMETLAVNIDRQAAMQRLTQQRRALLRERDELLLGVGKKVYTLHVRGKVRNRDVLADCRKIDELREQIKRLLAEMDAIRLRAMGEPGQERLEDESALSEEEESSTESAPAPETPAAPGTPPAPENATVVEPPEAEPEEQPEPPGPESD